DPDANHVQHALEHLDFLVVQDIFLTETAQLADVVLPGASFAEKDGTFSNTERRVQRVRKAIEPLAGKADWEVIAEVSTRMGYPMNYSSPEEIFSEIRTVTPSYTGITYSRIDEKGLQWPCPDENHPGTPILHTSQFSRGKGLFKGIKYEEPAENPDKEYPFVLSTGRRLQHYHTGTMTRRSKGLDTIFPEEYLEINTQDASQLGINDGDNLKVSSRRGDITIKAKVTDMVTPGLVFTSFHFAENAINKLTTPSRDPIAKIPQLKVCAVKIEKVS
ncbi:MAG TPA: molybdopterin dinucleotide binding domain-containing protein, partial [Clostridia bacterium]|nr:molybdopterin dinucleotide binding domain-containing protein [Clostridia bacterium]